MRLLKSLNLLKPIKNLYSSKVPTGDISSKHNNVSTKKTSIKLNTFCPTATLMQLSSVEALESLDKACRNSLASRSISKTKLLANGKEKDSLNPTLYEIVNDSSEFSNQLIKQISIKTTDDPDTVIKQTNSLSALLLRIRRFRLKLLAILFLHGHFEFGNAAILAKINDLLSELQNRKITLKFDAQPLSKGPAITVDSTINLVAKALTKAEAAVKELLTPLILCYNLPLSKNIFTGDFMQGAIHDIAPKGFDGVQGDYYYIFHLLELPEPFAAFNETQKAQWNSYFNELNLLFHFYTLKDVRIDFSVFINNHQHLINLPYSTFMEQTSVSKNTYSRLIHALNDFILIAWSQLILQRHAHFFPSSTVPTE